MFRLLFSVIIYTILTSCAPSETQQTLTPPAQKEKKPISTKIDTAQIFAPPNHQKGKRPHGSLPRKIKSQCKTHT